MNAGTPRGTGAELATVLLGAGAEVLERGWRAAGPLRKASWAVLDRARGLLPGGLEPILAERGRSVRADLERLAEAVLRDVVRRVVAAVLATTDLTELVCRHVDLDAVAAELDVDAVARRLDVDAVVARVDLDATVRRVDLDAVAARLDLNALATQLDLNALATQLDLNRLATRLDLNALATQLDLNTLATQLDLNTLAGRLDPDRVVARVDLDAVLDRVDMVGIAREIIDAVDLPEIVRQSSGALTSDTVRSMRTEAMHADDAVAGFVDRVLRRTRAAAPDAR